jgi:hypothetical protein
LRRRCAAGGAWRLLGRNAERSFAVSAYLRGEGRRAWPSPCRVARAGAAREHETTLRIELRALGDRTELTMIQGAFLDRTGVDNHNRGWSQSFDKLAALLGRTA